MAWRQILGCSRHYTLLICLYPSLIFPNLTSSSHIWRLLNSVCEFVWLFWSLNISCSLLIKNPLLHTLNSFVGKNTNWNCYSHTLFHVLHNVSETRGSSNVHLWRHKVLRQLWLFWRNVEENGITSVSTWKFSLSFKFLSVSWGKPDEEMKLVAVLFITEVISLVVIPDL